MSPVEDGSAISSQHNGPSPQAGAERGEVLAPIVPAASVTKRL